MSKEFNQVKDYITNLGFEISSENHQEEIILVNDESRGIINLLIDCEDPILVFEQFIGVVKNESVETYKKLLSINRELIHGAFVIDPDSNRLLFRDTLQLKNLDENEVEGTISALSLAMSEYSNFLISICK